jgi:hypothetical protein
LAVGATFTVQFPLLFVLKLSVKRIAPEAFAAHPPANVTPTKRPKYLALITHALRRTRQSAAEMALPDTNIHPLPTICQGKSGGFVSEILTNLVLPRTSPAGFYRDLTSPLQLGPKPVPKFGASGASELVFALI